MPPTARGSISRRCSRRWTRAASPRTWAFPFQSPRGAGYAAVNAEVAAAAEASGGRVVAFARSEPGEHFQAELESGLDAGARGIKLHTSLPGYDFSHPQLDVAFALAAERRVPILFHTGPRRAAVRARPRAPARAPSRRAGRARALRDRRPPRGLRAAPPEHPLRHVALELARRARAARGGRARAAPVRLRRAVLHADRHAGEALPAARRGRRERRPARRDVAAAQRGASARRASRARR